MTNIWRHWITDRIRSHFLRIFFSYRCQGWPLTSQGQHIRQRRTMVARRNVIGTPLFRRNRHRIVLSGKFVMPACLQPSSTRIPCVFFSFNRFAFRPPHTWRVVYCHGPFRSTGFKYRTRCKSVSSDWLPESENTTPACYTIHNVLLSFPPRLDKDLAPLNTRDLITIFFCSPRSIKAYR